MQRGWQNHPSVRPSRRRARGARLALLAVALAGGGAVGALEGRTLVARAFPERAAQVRLALLGQRHADAAELAAAAGVRPGVRLDDLALADVQAGVASHPWVKQARVAALPPDRLLVAIEEREAVAWTRIGAVTWLVDADGAAFVAGAAPGLPELAGASAPDDPRLAEGAAWLAALTAQGLAAPEALWLSDADPARAPVLALAPAAGAPGARVLLGAGEREAKLARLARLLASGLPELATTGEIDLRFGTAVVLRPRPEPELATDSRISNGG